MTLRKQKKPPKGQYFSEEIIFLCDSRTVKKILTVGHNWEEDHLTFSVGVEDGEHPRVGVPADRCRYQHATFFRSQRTIYASPPFYGARFDCSMSLPCIKRTQGPLYIIYLKVLQFFSLIHLFFHHSVRIFYP
jgi:hypothetical protein